MGENDKIRKRIVEKLYFFPFIGTNRKHNIIYKLTYTIIFNNLHKFSVSVSSLQKIICFRLGVGDQNLFPRQAFFVPRKRKEGGGGGMSLRFEIFFRPGKTESTTKRLLQLHELFCNEFIFVITT